MAFCRKCGAEIDDEAVICPKCGVAQQTSNTSNGGEVSGSARNTSAIAGIGIFLMPIGWIMYASMDKDSPKAKDLFVGNIIGTVIWALLILLWPTLTQMF